MIGIFTYMHMNYTILRVSIVINYNSSSKALGALVSSPQLLGIRRNLFAALCNDDANGNVPLGKSCNRYWQCQGGYPRLQRCPAMLVFDRRSLRCVVPPTEDCDVPTTPPPTEGELPDGRNEQEPEEENLPPGVPPLPSGALPIPLRARPRN